MFYWAGLDEADERGSAWTVADVSVVAMAVFPSDKLLEADFGVSWPAVPRVFAKLFEELLHCFFVRFGNDRGVRALHHRCGRSA
jgi:hypothetical protein